MAIYDYAREKYEASKYYYPEFNGPTKAEIKSDMLEPEKDEEPDNEPEDKE